MAVYRKNTLNGVLPPDVPIAQLKGGKVAKSSRFASVHRGLDSAPAMGRRVLLTQSASGQDIWYADTNDGSPRVMARSRADLTPGHYLAMSALHLPSGDMVSGGSFGEIQLDVEWTDRDGGTTSTTHILTLAPGPDKLTNPWEGVQVKRMQNIQPETLTNTTTLRDWSRHSHVEMTLTYNGNPRVIDVCVYEQPLALALEEDDDDDFWVSGFLYGPGPEGIGPSLSYPLQRISETTPDGDRRGGNWMVMDQVNAQALRLGPMLFHYCSSNVGVKGADGSNNNFVFAADDTDWHRVSDDAQNSNPLTLVAAAQPGWSMTSGAYGRPVQENPTASMGNTGSIPVWVFLRILTLTFEHNSMAYDFRLYVTPYSYIEISGTAPEVTEPAWVSAYGHLKCGGGPGDWEKVTAVIRTDAVGYVDQQLAPVDIVVFKADQYDPAA